MHLTKWHFWYARICWNSFIQKYNNIALLRLILCHCRVQILWTAKNAKYFTQHFSQQEKLTPARSAQCQITCNLHLYQTTCSLSQISLHVNKSQKHLTSSFKFQNIIYHRKTTKKYHFNNFTLMPLKATMQTNLIPIRNIC